MRTHHRRTDSVAAGEVNLRAVAAVARAGIACPDGVQMRRGVHRRDPQEGAKPCGISLRRGLKTRTHDGGAFALAVAKPLGVDEATDLATAACDRHVLIGSGVE